MRYLSDKDLSKMAPAEDAAFASPIPTQMVSNGEFHPLPQTPQQKQVEARIKQLADDLGRQHGMNRRQFLASSAGMAAAFIAMNEVFGPMYTVSAAEAAAPGAADERAGQLANQFIFDCQTHFVRDDYTTDLTPITRFARAHWNPEMEGEITLDRLKFANYLKEVYVDSDTDVAILSGSPVDDEVNLFLTNDQIASARRSVNTVAGSRRMLAHGIIQPKSEGWLDDVDYAIEELKVDSWKGYTIGDPMFQTQKQSQWRLDDEALVYPFYEKIQKAGINTLCIHKGLMPADYETSWPGLWEHATVSDLGKAAKDWPGINFVIYHSAMRPFIELPDASLKQFEDTGRIDWVTDLAAIPGKFGVSNVYAELGTCFANTSVTHPRLAAAMLGQLIKGLGADKIVWGTDSVWYGSPQWQIEAMRRLEIPQDMQEQHGFAPLGAADGPVKTAIFSGNAAKMYNVDVNAAVGELSIDHISEAKAEFQALNTERSNLRYGYVAKA
ncbi:MAG: amidohydrolase family protein [Woeseiaceae bacterium]|nr:amidohydrolase family protein [Woeseiaceae bacterium]